MRCRRPKICRGRAPSRPMTNIKRLVLAWMATQEANPPSMLTMLATSAKVFPPTVVDRRYPAESSSGKEPPGWAHCIRKEITMKMPPPVSTVRMMLRGWCAAGRAPPR